MSSSQLSLRSCRRYRRWRRLERSACHEGWVGSHLGFCRGSAFLVREDGGLAVVCTFLFFFLSLFPLRVANIERSTHIHGTIVLAFIFSPDYGSAFAVRENGGLDVFQLLVFSIVSLLPLISKWCAQRHVVSQLYSNNVKVGSHLRGTRKHKTHLPVLYS